MITLNEEIIMVTQSLNITISRTHRKLKKGCDISINSTSIYLISQLLDMLICFKNIESAGKSNNEYEKLFFARVLSVLYFDIYNYLNKNIFGMQLCSYRKLESSNQIFHNIDKSTKEIKQQLKSNYPLIDKMRNKLIAHRDDLSGWEQNEVAKNCGAEEILHIGIMIKPELDSIIEHLYHLDLMNSLS
jgi:hypothetical protein